MCIGLNASLFLLNAMLRHHISKFKDEDAEFVRKMIESFYVDDLVTGEDNTGKAFTLYKGSKERLARVLALRRLCQKHKRFG